MKPYEKIIKSLALIFLTWILVSSIQELYYNTILYQHGWILGDWMIHYEDGGFKRRGTTGSLSFIVQDIFGVLPHQFIFLLQSLIYIAFIATFIKLFFQQKVSVYYLTLIFTPLTFLFFLNDTNAIGRKEIILYGIFLLYIYFLSKNMVSWKHTHLIVLLIFLGTLTHEIILFYIPYFWLAYFMKFDYPDYKKYLAYLLAGLIPMILIFFFGANINEGNSIEILRARSVEIGPGIFTWPDDFNTMSYYQKNLDSYILYFIPFLIGIIHFFSYTYIIDRANFKKLFLFFLFCFIWSLPIFFMAIDWGRWVHIHFMLLLFSFLLLTPKQQGKTLGVHFLKNFIIVVLLIFLMLLWRMPNCCKNGIEFESFFTPF